MRRWPPAVLALGTVAASSGSHAQSANCETFKASVAARIEARGVQGYALELVRRGRPLPAGMRSVGTCDGGAYTVAYRRWALAGAVDAAASDPQPGAPPATPEAARRLLSKPSAASAAAPRAGPQPAPSPGKAAPAPMPASSGMPPGAASASVAPPAPTAPVATLAAAPVPAPVPAPTPAPPPAPLRDAKPGAAADLDRTIGRWILIFAGIAAVYGGVRLWRWVRYHRYYDEKGLPRGPRMTL